MIGGTWLQTNMALTCPSPKLPLEIELMIFKLYAHDYPLKDVLVLTLVSTYVKDWRVMIAPCSL